MGIFKEVRLGNWEDSLLRSPAHGSPDPWGKDFPHPFSHPFPTPTPSCHPWSLLPNLALLHLTAFLTTGCCIVHLFVYMFMVFLPQKARSVKPVSFYSVHQGSPESRTGLEPRRVLLFSHSLASSSFAGLKPARHLCPCDFPGKNTGVGCHFLLQGTFPTQGSNPGLPHCRQTL